MIAIGIAVALALAWLWEWRKRRGCEADLDRFIEDQHQFHLGYQRVLEQWERKAEQRTDTLVTLTRNGCGMARAIAAGTEQEQRAAASAWWRSLTVTRDRMTHELEE